MSRGAIWIKTGVPGPKSCKIAVRKEQVVPMAIDTLAPFFIAEGKGALPPFLETSWKKRNEPQVSSWLSSKVILTVCAVMLPADLQEFA